MHQDITCQKAQTNGGVSRNSSDDLFFEKYSVGNYFYTMKDNSQCFHYHTHPLQYRIKTEVEKLEKQTQKAQN